MGRSMSQTPEKGIERCIDAVFLLDGAHRRMQKSANTVLASVPDSWFVVPVAQFCGRGSRKWRSHREPPRRKTVALHRAYSSISMAMREHDPFRAFARRDFCSVFCGSQRYRPEVAMHRLRGDQFERTVREMSSPNQSSEADEFFTVWTGNPFPHPSQITSRKKKIYIRSGIGFDIEQNVSAGTRTEKKRRNPAQKRGKRKSILRN